ncbi:MAG TPA: flagellar biosynthesis protein FlhF [Desulfosporosinus sp.]|nr:flagellar biosynthesis protein FlhF [Desulfosporosinus sp.]
MRVRRFVGDNVAHTMGIVKRELGSEAVILQTREFREGGFLGLFGKMRVEITAAIEEKPVTAQKVPEVSLVTDAKEQTGDLQAEIISMRRMLEKMNKHVEGLGEEKSAWPSLLQRWAEHLKGRGISENLVRLLITQVQQTLLPEEWADDTLVYARIEANVRQLCGQIGLIQPGINKPRIVALIGATGVGKTTTIGKLAAGFSIVDRRKVALITADTYRVAAVEQLRTFGEIIGVPVEVVMTPTGLRESLDLHADKELIFIDTAGRSPHHELHMTELRAFLEKAQPDFTMLVMSATTQFADQLKIYKRFEGLTTHLIFTKLDETGSAGSILNLLSETTLPTAYLTNGQNVPDDIEAATPYRMAHHILGEEMPHA